VQGGVRGVIDTYRAALSRVELSGPTNFEPCIKVFHQKCQKMPRDGSRYQVQKMFKKDNYLKKVNDLEW
jgi:hypothetical protein